MFKQACEGISAVKLCSQNRTRKTSCAFFCITVRRKLSFLLFLWVTYPKKLNMWSTAHQFHIKQWTHRKKWTDLQPALAHARPMSPMSLLALTHKPSLSREEQSSQKGLLHKQQPPVFHRSANRLPWVGFLLSKLPVYIYYMEAGWWRASISLYMCENVTSWERQNKAELFQNLFHKL